MERHGCIRIRNASQLIAPAHAIDGGNELFRNNVKLKVKIPRQQFRYLLYNIFKPQPNTPGLYGTLR